MSFEHPYPDNAYLEIDTETNEKRWYGTKGMGVAYVHEDHVAELVDAAVAAERERCAKLAEDNTDFRMLQDFGMQSMCDQLCTNIAEAIRCTPARQSFWPIPTMIPLATTEPSVEVVNAVAEALSNALENGHDFKGWTDEKIADDMYDWGGIDDDMPREEVIIAIRALRT